MVEAQVMGTFTGGYLPYDLAQDGVGYATREASSTPWCRRWKD